MDRAEAMRRLKSSTEFTLVGGRVLVRDPRILAAVAEIREERPQGGSRRPSSGQLPRTGGLLPS